MLSTHPFHGCQPLFTGNITGEKQIIHTFAVGCLIQYGTVMGPGEAVDGACEFHVGPPGASGWRESLARSMAFADKGAVIV